MKIRLLSLLALVLMPLLASAQGIGFVNMEEVILRYSKTQEITTRLEERLQEKRNLIRQRQAGIMAQRDGLELLEDKPLEKLHLMKKIRQEEEELKIEERHILVTLEQEIARHMKRVYQEVLEVVADLATKQKLSLVLMVQTRKVEGTRRDQVEANIVTRPVLWHDPKLDLTAKVLETLNKTNK